MTTYNHVEWLKESLRTFFKYTPKELYEFFVLDNLSSDGTIDYLLQNKIPFISTGSKMSLPSAFNLALKNLLLRTDINFICHLHNDMLFTPKWLEHSTAILQTLPSKTYLSVSFISGPDTIKLSDIQREKISFSAQRNDLKFANSSPVIMPSKMLKDVGPLDDVNFPVDAADVDFNIRCFQKGYSLLCTNRVVIFHCYAMTRFNGDYLYSQGDSDKEKCYKKYGYSDFARFNYVNNTKIFVDGIQYSRMGV